MSPDEPASTAPEFHGRSVSPESPRPLHIPEPSNIPVLENQIDPIFNLMTTHLAPPFSMSNVTAMDLDLAAREAAEQKPAQGGESLPPGPQLVPSSINPSEQFTTGQDTSALTPNQGASALPGSVSDITDAPAASATAAAEAVASSADATAALLSSLRTQTYLSEPPAQSSILQTSNDQLSSEAPLPLQGDDAHDLLKVTAPPTQLSNGQARTTLPSEVDYQDLLAQLGSIVSTAAPTTTDSNINTLSLDNRELPNASASQLPVFAIQPTTSVLSPPAVVDPVPATAPDALESIAIPQIPESTQPATSSAEEADPTLASAATERDALTELETETQDVDTSLPEHSEEQATTGNADSHAAAVDSVAQNGTSPWPPDLEAQYEQFLKDEDAYTSEGSWDKFPQGSRLFIGNLPSELVDKRDVFLIFHSYGRLAQISIKQAYGFVQYMEVAACQAAIGALQDGKIKERTIHLEVSKPSRASRGSLNTEAGRRGRDGGRRKSLSPHGRGRGHRGSRGNGPHHDFRGEPRRRDSHRSGRSPSPRGYRVRDDYRGAPNQSSEYYKGYRRNRSRSPYGSRNHMGRSPSPRGRHSLHDDANLPMARRDPRDVPDVQIILLDNLDRAFIAYMEKAFLDRGLRVATLLLPNVPLAAVIHRQILEGVQAVVRLDRNVRALGRIPLQVFDRSAGVDAVRFEEYDDLEPHVAAEVTLRAKQKASNTFSSTYNPGRSQYPGQSQMPRVHANTQTPSQPDLTSMISSLDGPALQKLLGALQHNPQAQTAAVGSGLPPSPSKPANPAGMIGGFHQPHLGMPPSRPLPPAYSYGGPAQAQQMPHPMAMPQQYNYPAAYPPQQAPPPGSMAYGAPPQARGQPSPQQVQNLMAQLARWKQ